MSRTRDTSHDVHFTFLRHGRSLADDEGRHEGAYDSPLTSVGRAQAARLAAYWTAHPPAFDVAFTSTLVRARETAEIVCAPLGLVPQPRDAWREFDNGPLAGLTFADAEARYPMPSFRHDLQALTTDGGESQAAFRARALTALADAWSSGATRILVVAHGGILNVALRELTGASRAAFAFGDTSFTTVRLSRASHSAMLTGVLRQPHLDAWGDTVAWDGHR